MSDRRVEFPEKVRVKRLHFAEYKCEAMLLADDGETKVRCNATLVRTRVEFDHDIAAELGGPATFDNCRAICKICHRAKYPSDAAKIAKAKRREIADIGATAPSPRPIPSRGFAPANKPKREPRPVAIGQTGIARQFRNAT